MIKFYVGNWWSGQILAIAVGISIGFEHSSAYTGIAVMFALQLLVDIRHKEMK